MIDRGDSLPPLVAAEKRILTRQYLSMARHSMLDAKNTDPVPFVTAEIKFIINRLDQLDQLMEMTR